jgi:hypothetical protein
MSQASSLPFQQYPSGVTLQQLLQQEQQQQQQQAHPQAFHHQQRFQPPSQPQAHPQLQQPQSMQTEPQPQPQPDPLTLTRWIQLQQQQQSQSRSQPQVQSNSQQQPQPQQQQQAVPPSRPQSQAQIRTQVDIKQPIQQRASSSTNIPSVATSSSAKPFIHDQLGVMMPHFEPSTGLESFCTLDRYIQQYIKAATGNPSPEVLVLQSTVDRLREARNQAVRDRHTLHGQYNELVRTHNDNVARMRTLDTTVANAKKDFEANLQTIVDLRAGYKVEQDRANEARMKSEGDAAKLAAVTAELHDIKTVTNHPGILFTKLQAERDAKEESIKKLEKRVAKAEEAAVVERNLRYLAEITAAQKARELEASQPTIGRLSIRVSELEKECAEQKTLKYDPAVARSDLKNANTEVTRLREAQSGIMARSDDMRTKNDGLTERVAELEAEALLPMPSTLLVHPGATANTTSVDQSTPLVDLPLQIQITLLKCALEQTRVDLKQAQADNVQLKSQITDLGTGAARSKVGLAVCRTQLKDSKDEQVLTEKELEESKTRNERFIDQIGDLKEMISKYEAQIELPLPSQTATPTVNHQHSVVVCDLQLEIATYKSELEKVRAELKQSLSDLEEARFPWYGMVLEQKEGQEGEEKKEAVDIVKAKIQALETTITTLQSTNGALQLQLDDIAAKAELKRLKDLAIKNARETTKLQILHSGGAGVIDVTTPTPTANPESSVINDDMMEVEVEVEVEKECGCGREEVIKEMVSRSEVVFEQTLILLENVRNAAQSKVEDSPLKDRAQSVRNVEVLNRYMEKVEGLVEHAREGVANRLV